MNQEEKQDEMERRIAACVNAFEGIPTERIAGKNLGEILAGEMRLHSAGPRADGGFGFEFSGGVCQLLAEAYAEQFKQAGAINYLELLFQHSEIGPLTITMQRVEGLTPAQKLALTEDQRDALAANEGYKQAFYEIADILGIGARPDSPKDVFEQVIKPMLINLTKESGQLATENAALLTRLRNIIDIVSKADNRYCMCGESMDSHSLGGCGSPIGMLDYHFGKLTDENPETPATDAYLNSVRAELIPEGYVIVPQTMCLSADAMESLCFHCGDGGFAFGDFTDGLLWVGDIENDDGTKTYGLNIATAEYPEEGSANISEFTAQLRAGEPL